MTTTTMPSALADLLDDFRARTVYRLASDAECGSPDSPTSPGARLLEHVRDSIIEAIEYDPDGRDDWDDASAEIADGAPSVYTHTKWAQFVDLGAYNEDPTELSDGSDMDANGSICLYIICQRLADAMFAEAIDARDNPEDTDDED